MHITTPESDELYIHTVTKATKLLDMSEHEILTKLPPSGRLLFKHTYTNKIYRCTQTNSDDERAHRMHYKKAVAMTKQQHPQLNTTETLELFIDKAEELADYAASTHAFGGLMGVFRNEEDKEWKIHLEIRGLLLTFRMFIQKNEDIAIYIVSKEGRIERPKLLTLPGLSASWYEQAERAYTNIVALFFGYDEAKKVQNHTTAIFMNRDLTPLPTRCIYNHKDLSRWEILQAFLYGYFAHNTPTQRQTYKQWQQEPELFNKLKPEFVSIIGFISGQIWEVMRASKQELASREPTRQEKREKKTDRQAQV